MSRRQTPGWLVLLSLLAAYVLAIVPLPDWAQPARPLWVALVMLFWCLEAPERAGIGSAWLAGLGLDLVTGGLLGEHALRLTIMIYIAMRFRRRFRFYPLWQQALAVLALLVNDRIVTLWIQGVMDHPWPDWRFWLGPLAGMLIWPFIFLLLDALRQRYRTP